MSRIVSLVVAAVVVALSFSSTSCILVTIPVLAAATVLPEKALPATIDDLGNMNREEGIVFGSVHVPIDPDARLVGRAAGGVYAQFDAAEGVIYSLIMFRLDRHGVPIRDQRWEADCTSNNTCSFAAKLTQGDYVANTIRMSQRRDDEYALEFGQIITRVDYRFTVAPREVKYLGRVSVSAPVYDESNEPELPLAIINASQADSIAVGLDQSETFVTALLQGDYKSRPVGNRLSTR